MSVKTDEYIHMYHLLFSASWTRILSTKHPGGGTSPCFMAWKAQGDHFQNAYEKKLEHDSNVEECSDYQKMSILWELPLS